jgi:hypothetical protein
MGKHPFCCKYFARIQVYSRTIDSVGFGVWILALSCWQKRGHKGHKEGAKHTKSEPYKFIPFNQKDFFCPIFRAGYQFFIFFLPDQEGCWKSVMSF